MPMPFNLSIKIACTFKAHISESPLQRRTISPILQDDSESEVTAQHHTETIEDTELEPRSLNSLFFLLH